MREHHLNIDIDLAKRRESILNMDYILIINTLDLLTDEAIFIEYPMEGHGKSFPKQTSVDISNLLNILRPREINEGRYILDVTTLIDYNGNVIWNSPGIVGRMYLK
jgi:hypothetical protein